MKRQSFVTKLIFYGIGILKSANHENLMTIFYEEENQKVMTKEKKK